MNNLKDLRAERKKLQVKEKALKQILVNETQRAVGQSSREIVSQINQFNDWGQLGLTALAIFQSFQSASHGEAATDSSHKPQQLSEWLALASDFASVVE